MGQVDRKVGIYDAAGNPINVGNPLPVTGTMGGGGGTTGQADKSLFTEGTSLAAPIAGVYNETLGVDPDEDSAIALRATVKRALHVNPRDASGNEIGTSAHPVRTDPTGATSQPVSDGGGTLTVDAVDGGIISLGTTTDAEASGNGSLIAIGKRIRTLLGGTLTVSITGTPTVTANIGTTGGLALDATLTGGTAKAIGRGQVDDTGTTTPAEDAYGDLRITPKRGLHANLRDNSGVEIGTSGSPVRTDPTGSTAQPVTDNSGSLTIDSADLGVTTDAEAAGNGSLIAVAKRIRTLLGGTGSLTANIGTTNGLALDATLTGGTVKAIGRGQVDDTGTATPSEDAYGDLRITPKRGLHTNLRDQAGAELATSGNPLRTDPTGSTTQPVSDAGGTLTTDSVDGGHVTLGTTTDAEVTGNGTLIAIAKRVRTLLGGTGSLTANIGTTNGLALDATLTGGTLKSIGRGQLDDASTTTPSEDGYADLRITAQRGLHANLRNTAGTEVGTSGAPLRTDPTGTTAQPITDNSGSLTIDSADLGTTTDVEAAGNGSLIAIAKRLRTLLGGTGSLTANIGTTNGLALDATLTGGTAKNIGRAQLDDTSTSTPSEDAYADLRITAQRGLHVNLRNNAGTELGTSGAPVRTDPTGSTTQPISGTVSLANGLTTGNLVALNDFVQLILTHHGTVAFRLLGTWVGTVTVEGYLASLVTPVNLPFKNVTTGAFQTSATANGLYVFDATGIRTAAIRASGFSSGPISVELTSNPSSDTVSVFGTVRVDPIGTTKQPVTEADGDNAALGTTTDAEASGNGSLIAVTKRLRTLLGGTLTVDSELPTAAALSDTLANPTAPMVGSALLTWDSVNTRWMRALNAESASAAAFDAGVLATQGMVFNTGDAKYYRSISAASTTGGADGTRIQTNALLAYNGTNFRLLRQDGNDYLQTANAVASQVDGHSASIGATTDAEATGNGSAIAILKRIRTLLGSTISVSIGAGTATLGGMMVRDADGVTTQTVRTRNGFGQAAVFDDDVRKLLENIWIELRLMRGVTD